MLTAATTLTRIKTRLVVKLYQLMLLHSLTDVHSLYTACSSKQTSKQASKQEVTILRARLNRNNGRNRLKGVKKVELLTKTDFFPFLKNEKEQGSSPKVACSCDFETFSETKVY